MELRARRAEELELAGGEPLLERLDRAEEALEALAERCGLEAEALRGRGGGWRARVSIDGTDVLVVADGDRWAIWLPAGGDEADAQLAARKLHGAIGRASDDWDLDR